MGKYGFNVTFTVTDKDRVKAIKHWSLGTMNATELLTKFFMAFHQTMEELYEKEKVEMQWKQKGIDPDDIPF